MRPRLQHRYWHGQAPRPFSAWTMAIVFITVAMISFAVDQAILFSPIAGVQPGEDLPSLLHPVQLIESLMDAASE